jgi:hypothetical protein
MINLRGWIVISLVCLMWVGAALAHDHGRTDPAWEETTPEIKEWYRTLKQPDNGMSCCGESDQYFCDAIHVKNGGKTYCTITDDRDDAQFARAHIPLGTEIEIPDHKLTWRYGNPVGHAVVFIQAGSIVRVVLCFVQNGGY